MKKIIVLLGMFFIPFAAQARGIMMDQMASPSCVSGMHHIGTMRGMMGMYLLGTLVLIIWGVVGVLAAVWLWQHIAKPKHHTTTS